MAKIKQRKLRWTGSDSPQVVGYKLYWEVGDKVSYNSEYVMVGNKTEIILPDDVDSFKPGSGPLEFGIAAVDEVGNESDLITIAAPYQFIIPDAPEEIWLESPDKTCQEDLLEELPEEISPEEKSLEEVSVEDLSESNPLAFLEQEFEEDAEAIVHRLPDNVAGHHSSASQEDITLALKRQVDKM